MSERPTKERLAEIRDFHALHVPRLIPDGVGCHGCQLLAEIDALTAKLAAANEATQWCHDHHS